MKTTGYTAEITTKHPDFSYTVSYGTPGLYTRRSDALRGAKRLARRKGIDNTFMVTVFKKVKSGRKVKLTYDLIMGYASVNDETITIHDCSSRSDKTFRFTL